MNPRRMLRLFPEEMNMIATLPKTKIKKEAKVHPETISKGIKRGSFCADVAFKLRAYLKTIPS